MANATQTLPPPGGGAPPSCALEPEVVATPEVSARTPPVARQPASPGPVSSRTHNGRRRTAIRTAGTVQDPMRIVRCSAERRLPNPDTPCRRQAVAFGEPLELGVDIGRSPAAHQPASASSHQFRRRCPQLHRPSGRDLATARWPPSERAYAPGVGSRRGKCW